MSSAIRYRTASALFSIGHLLAGTSLLAVSVAFIAACAIAGQAGVLAGFNYVVPSAAIRLLAVARIAFGYFDKYFGHLALLKDLKQSRQQQLQEVLNRNKNISQPEAARTLHAQTELWAGRYAAIHNPALAVLSTVLSLTVVYLLLLPFMLVSWLVLLLALASITALIQWQNQLAYRRSYAQETETFHARQAWLQRSVLWHLEVNSHEQQYQQALTTSVKHELSKRWLSVGELLILATGLMWATGLAFFAPAQHSVTLYWLIPIIMASASLDWWGPLLHAALNRPAVNAAKRNLSHATTTSCKDHHGVDLPADVIVFKAQNFQWLREQKLGHPISWQLAQTGLALLTASSGEGKSSGFLALVGELSYQGSACINGIELRDTPLEQRRKRLHYAEQHAHILNDTLAENLRLAAPNADDTALFDALTWAGLATWANPSMLTVWLGHEGRPISGGEQKRLTLARAKLSDAPIWLLDEPFEGLDQDHINFLAQQIKTESQHRLIIIASHIVPETLSHSEVVSMTFNAVL